jgi:excinuclease UvrABC nuclease subunit
MPEGREEIVALLALERAEGIGHERLRRLLAHFGSARAALEASDWSPMTV